MTHGPFAAVVFPPILIMLEVAKQLSGTIRAGQAAKEVLQCFPVVSVPHAQDHGPERRLAARGA